MQELKKLSHAQTTISKSVTIEGKDFIITGVTYEIGVSKRTLSQLKIFDKKSVGKTVCELNREDVIGTNQERIIESILFTFSIRVREFKQYMESL